MAAPMVRWRMGTPASLRDFRHLWGRVPMRVLKRRARREVRFRILRMSSQRDGHPAEYWVAKPQGWERVTETEYWHLAAGE